MVPGLCTFHVNSHLQSGAAFVFSCRFQKWPTSTASNGFNIANCRFATLLVWYQKDHRLLHRFRWPFCWLKTHSTSLTHFYPLSIHPATRVFFCMSVWRPSSAGNIARVMRWCCCWPPCRLQNNWPYLLVANTYCLELPGCWILRLNRIDAYGSGSGASWSWNHGVPHVDASLKIRAAARAKKCPGPPGPCRPRNGLLIHVPEGHGFKFQQILCTAQILRNKHVQTFLAFSHMVLHLGSVDIFWPCLFATHGNAQLGQKLVGLQKIASFIAHGLPWWEILKIPTINAFLAFLRPSNMKILSSKLDGYSSSWNLSDFVGFRMYSLWFYGLCWAQFQRYASPKHRVEACGGTFFSSNTCGGMM